MPIAAPMLARSIVVSPDVRLEYVESGNPAGLPVVFLHGVTDSWGSFEGLLASLPASIRAIAVSQRGHGNSSRPARGYRMVDFSGDLLGFMNALELPAAVIVGHSMGSFIAQRFAADHPERVRGLVLMGSTASLGSNAAVREMVDALEPMTDPIDPGFVREFQASTLARPIDPALFHAVVAESLKVPVRIWREMFTGFLEVDHTTLLPRIQAPTLVAWGTCDSMFTEADQTALCEGIAGARRVTYPGAGHGFHWEDAATFAADLTAFCREVR